MKIVVLAGGLSTERDVSLSTGTMVCNALRSAGQQAILVDLFFGVREIPANIDEAFEAKGMLPASVIRNDAPDLDAVRRSRPGEGGLGGIGPNVIRLCKAADIVFMAMHGEPGENGMIQAMFDIMEIKYTGAGYFGSALAMDKGVSKQLFLHHSISTPEGRLFRKAEAASIDFTLPCIVKPCSGGSSIGVKKAFTRDDLASAVNEAFRYEDEILIERFITGREFTCGVVGNVALPPAEVIPKGDFYDYAHKYQSGLITEICPAQIPDELTEEIKRTSLAVCDCLHLDIYARMDYIYDGEKLYCLEANTLPGMTPTSHLPQEAKAAGISYEQLCMRIIELSLKKYEQGAK